VIPGARENLSGMTQPWRTRVLDYLDAHAHDLVDDLSALVRTPSISGSDDENTIQHALGAELTELGLQVDLWPVDLAETYAAQGFPGVEVARREAHGLVARVAGHSPDEAPSLMLNGHVDVVPPGDLAPWRGADPFSGHADTHHVHGRGSCDMKGGLVAAMWVVRAMAELDVPLRGDLLLACVQAEEDGGLGTFAMLRRGWTADACVVPEPTSLHLVPATGGALTFRLRVAGLATHASRRTSGVSAVEKFVPLFRALRDLEDWRNADVHPLMAAWDVAYPIEVGTVRAGDWSSSVPDLLVAEGRYGVALGESPEAAKAVFEDTVRQVCGADPWLRDHPVVVEWWGGQFASGYTDPEAPVVHAVRRAHEAVGGAPQRVSGAPYGSDLRLLSNLAGIPTVHYGPGSPDLAHAPGERVPIAEVLTTARALAVLALDHCGTR
jgi:acetylornithine deacetylase